jgi:hypothetical protein
MITENLMNQALENNVFGGNISNVLFFTLSRGEPKA